MLRIATLNVRDLICNDRLVKLSMVLEKADVDLVGMQETKERRGLTNVRVGEYVSYSTSTEETRGVGIGIEVDCRYAQRW